MTVCSYSAETIQEIIHWQFHFNSPSGYWSQHQVFRCVNFVPPHGGMCIERKPLILHKHVTSITLLSEGFITAAFSFCCPRWRLSRSVTSRISNTYTESGTEWDYQRRVPLPRLYSALLKVQFLACHPAVELEHGLQTQELQGSHHMLQLNVCS